MRDLRELSTVSLPSLTLGLSTNNLCLTETYNRDRETMGEKAGGIGKGENGRSLESRSLTLARKYDFANEISGYRGERPLLQKVSHPPLRPLNSAPPSAATQDDGTVPTLLQLAQLQGEAADALAATVEDLTDAWHERMAICLEAGDISEADAHRTAALEIGSEFARRFALEAPA